MKYSHEAINKRELRGFEWFTGGHIRLLQAIAGSTAVALEHARYVAWLEGENRRLTEAINVEHGMTCRSEKMQQVYQLVSRADRKFFTMFTPQRLSPSTQQHY